MSASLLQRGQCEARRVHLVVDGHALVDAALHVRRQVGQLHGAFRSSIGRLERAARQDALEPRQPVLEDLQEHLL